MPGRRMLISDLPWILEDPKSDYCIRAISTSKIYFNWDEVQKHYNIKTQEDSFVHNLRTNYGWTKTCPCPSSCSCLVSKKGYWKHPDLESGSVASVRDLQPKPSTRIRKRQRRKELKEQAKKKQEDAEARAQQAEAKLREVSRLMNLAETSQEFGDVSALGHVATKSRRTFDNSNPRSSSQSDLSSTDSPPHPMTQSPQSSITDSSSTSPIPESSLDEPMPMRQALSNVPNPQNFMIPTQFQTQFQPPLPTQIPQSSYQTFFQQAPMQMSNLSNSGFPDSQCLLPSMSGGNLNPLSVQTDSDVELPNLNPKLQIITSSEEAANQNFGKNTIEVKARTDQDSDCSESSPHLQPFTPTANQGLTSTMNTSMNFTLPHQQPQQQQPQNAMFPTQLPPQIARQLRQVQQQQPRPQLSQPQMSRTQQYQVPQNLNQYSLPPLSMNPRGSTMTHSRGGINTQQLAYSSVAESGALSLGMQNFDARSIVAAAQRLKLQMLMAQKGVSGLNGLTTQNVNLPQITVDDLRSKLLANNPPPPQPQFFQQTLPQQPNFQTIPNPPMNDFMQPAFQNIHSVPNDTPALKPISSQEFPFIDA